ncbi:MAG: hypothetical protein O2968_07155 [Acidobacteria bacterium]|nr:hypothetical protein [Acidobacteriota bacterium]
MGETKQDDRLILREASGPTPDCLSDDELMAAFESENGAGDRITQHMAECAHCQAEVALMRDFHEAEAGADEQGHVAWIAEQLKASFVESETVERNAPAHPRREVKSRGSFLRDFFGTNPFATTAWAGASAALLVAGGLWIQDATRSTLAPGVIDGPQVFRTTSIEGLSPRGDLTAPPESFEWNAVDGATAYKIEAMEVDRSIVWALQTESAAVAAPAQLRAIAVPGKTLLWRVSAVNSAGQTVAISEVERFRVAVQSSGGEPAAKKVR